MGPYFTSAVPYKILRQPMPLAIDPLQLPAGTAIDLRASGVGVGVGVKDYFYVGPSVSDTRGVNNSDSIVIMFAPEGRVSRVSYNQNGLKPLDKVSFDQPIVDNLYLMIGRREGCPPPTVATDPTLDSSKLPATGVQDREQQLLEMKKNVNWLRKDCKWVVIGAASGRVVTVENAAVDPQAVIDKYPVAVRRPSRRNRKSFAIGKSSPPASSLAKCGKRGEVSVGLSALGYRLSAKQRASGRQPTANS